MKKSIKTPNLELGVCYYPEHWPEHLWADDMRRMREMGMSIIRIAEFAWTIFEPSEGVFDFNFFDKVMALADEHGLKVVMGTPTATPPAWLTQKYPEVLNMTQVGVVYQHGQRRHYNYNSEVYRDQCACIAGKMAEHYNNHPALDSWQIDNELNCETNVFYSAADQVAFRNWCKAKYKSLGALNEAWGTVFWNQTYSDWEQVYLTRPNPSDSPNPHQALDEKRFISDSVISFAKCQVDAIRAFDKIHPITTNGLFGHLDSHELTNSLLDYISYDAYPLFAEIWPDTGELPLLDRVVSTNLSKIRDISPNFCIMEQQSGPGGWVNKMALPSPKPGQMRLWTYQSVAHGAERILYFRWRTATMGTEIYWHGINDYHNQPNRRCAEAAQVGSEFAKIGKLVAGSKVHSEVAILRDYDNEWDGELDVWHGPFTKQSESSWHQALQRLHVPADVITLRDGMNAAMLAAYKCVIYPHPAILTDATASVLADYVKSGGTVIFGCRTGYKNITGQCNMRPFPGPIADLCGVTVEDFTRIGANQKEVSLDWKGRSDSHGHLTTGPFNDILKVNVSDARILGVYGSDAGYYAGKPALVERQVGMGKALYYGGVFTTSVARSLALHFRLGSPVASILTISPEIELVVRERSDNTKLIFLLNYSDKPQPLNVLRPMRELINESLISGELNMDPYAVAILQA